MGNTNFKENPSPGLLTPEQVERLQKQILFEYPFLSSVYESMLITDNDREDCPIVFANDEFEAMTMYNREEILGRNCRFLQGKYTDKSVVLKIRTAIQNSTPIDVEILNYRKDGVAFWNAFLMLPIHQEGTKSGRAGFFIAIQKDMTMYKEVGSHPIYWTPPEVAIWLEKNGLDQSGKHAVQNEISGDILLEMDSRDLSLLGIDDPAEKEKLSELIKSLKASYPESSLYLDLPNSKMAPSTSEADVMPNQKINDQISVTHNLIPNPSWRTTPSSIIALKCHYPRAETQLLVTEADATWKDILELLEKNFGTVTRIIFKKNGTFSQITNENELRALLTEYKGKTLPLWLEDGHLDDAMQK